MDDDIHFLDLPNDILRYELAPRLDCETRNSLRICNKELFRLVDFSALKHAVDERICELHHQLQNLQIIITEVSYEIGNGHVTRICSPEYASQQQKIWPNRFMYFLCHPTEAHAIRAFHANEPANLTVVRNAANGYFEVQHTREGSDLQHIHTMYIKNDMNMYLDNRSRMVVLPTSQQSSTNTKVNILAHVKYCTQRLSEFMDYLTSPAHNEVVFDCE